MRRRVDERRGVDAPARRSGDICGIFLNGMAASRRQDTSCRAQWCRTSDKSLNIHDSTVLEHCSVVRDAPQLRRMLRYADPGSGPGIGNVQRQAASHRYHRFLPRGRTLGIGGHQEWRNRRFDDLQAR